MSENLPPLDDGDFVLSDVDSCAVTHETLTGFTKFLGDEAAERVEVITNQGMNGSMGFVSSLTQRAAVLYEIGATRQDVKDYRDHLAENPKQHITPSFLAHADWIADQAGRGRFMFVSGGMEEMVEPLLVGGLGVPKEAIRTNAFKYEDSSPTARIVGFEGRPLFHDLGKLLQIRCLRQSGIIDPMDRVYMVGDGDNDRKAVGIGGADYFINLVEVVDRDLDQGVNFKAEDLPQAIHWAINLSRTAALSEFDATRQAV